MPWTVARQALLSMEFSRQQYWSCPSPGHLPNPGIEPCLLHCRWILYHLSSLQLFLWWAVGLCQTTTTMTTLSPKGTVWLPTEGTDAFLWEIHPTSPSMAQCQEAEVWSCVKLLYLGKNRKRTSVFPTEAPSCWIWICSVISRFGNMVLYNNTQIPGNEKWQNHTQRFSTSLELCLFLSAHSILSDKFKLWFISLKQNLFNVVLS